MYVAKINYRKELDSWEHGLLNEGCLSVQLNDIHAEDIFELFDIIEEEHPIKVSKLEYCEINKHFSTSVMENDRGNPPTPSERKKFKNGEINLFCCDYDIKIYHQKLVDNNTVKYMMKKIEEVS